MAGTIAGVHEIPSDLWLQVSDGVDVASASVSSEWITVSRVSNVGDRMGADLAHNAPLVDGMRCYRRRYRVTDCALLLSATAIVCLLGKQSLRCSAVIGDQ